jgi:hypothetical protein
MHELSSAENDLVTLHRESSVNDNVMLSGLLTDLAALSTAHRTLVYKVADALRSAAAWRTGVAR